MGKILHDRFFDQSLNLTPRVKTFELSRLPEIRRAHCQQVIDEAAKKKPRTSGGTVLSWEYLKKIRGTMARLFKDLRRQELINCSPAYNQSCNATPTEVAPFALKEMAPAAFRTCALEADGAVDCFGDARGGLSGVVAAPESCAGIPCTHRLNRISPLAESSAVAVGFNFSCARTASDGKVLCWGSKPGWRIRGRKRPLSAPHADSFGPSNTRFRRSSARRCARSQQRSA